MTAATQTLAAWLLEQIAADEAAFNAEALRKVGPHVGGEVVWFRLPKPLAECEAHRRIVELHSDSAPFCDSRVDHGMTHREAYDAYPQQREWCDTLRALAAVYADHEDWREEWA